jgi:hypothetical protein
VAVPESTAAGLAHKPSLNVFSDDDEPLFDEEVRPQHDQSVIRTIHNYFVTHIHRIRRSQCPTLPNSVREADRAEEDDDDEESAANEPPERLPPKTSRRIKKQKFIKPVPTNSFSLPIYIIAFMVLLGAIYLSFRTFVQLVPTSSSNASTLAPGPTPSSSAPSSQTPPPPSHSISADLIAMQTLHNQQIQAFDARLRHLESVLEVQRSKVEQLNYTLKEALELMRRSTPIASSIPSLEHHISLDEIQRLIKQAIAKYDADKTGLTDFALETSGAQVLSIRCSKTFEKYGTQYSVFGIPFWRSTTSPRSVIQQNKAPGECWPFVGAQGHLVIKLSQQIVPNNFSYEHIPIQISRDGNLSTAPKQFEVRSLDYEEDSSGELLGRYLYESNGEPLQFFSVQHPNPKPTQFIELVVMDNHGHPEYTCLYRFRVHGERIKL